MGINGSLTGNLYIKLPDGTIHKVLDIKYNNFMPTSLLMFDKYHMPNCIIVSLPDNYFEYEEDV